MTSNEQVIDSKTGWVADHIKNYVESNGERGHLWRGITTLLLTTRGRKSGNLRRTALIYGMDDDRYLVVGSIGGGPKHPAWYLNLVANPEVDVQAGAEKFKALARPAKPGEKPRLWEIMTTIFPTYIEYQKQTSREIPVVILERKLD